MAVHDGRLVLAEKNPEITYAELLVRNPRSVKIPMAPKSDPLTSSKITSSDVAGER